MKKVTIEQAVQELATVEWINTDKMIEVFGHCTVAELKQYVGFLAIDTKDFKKADWVKQAVAKLSHEKFQAAVEAMKVVLEQQRKELATKLSSVNLETLPWPQLRTYAHELGVIYTKHTKKAELIRDLLEKIHEILAESEGEAEQIINDAFEEATRDLQILEDAYEHHRLVDFSGNFMDIRYVEPDDIEMARERVRLFRDCA